MAYGSQGDTALDHGTFTKKNRPSIPQRGTVLLALRYTLRSLARSRGFVAVAVLSLGISLGLASVTFAALDAVIHPYVPFTASDRLFYVTQWGTGSGGTVTWHDKYLEVRDGARIHDEIALVSFQTVFVEGPNNVENASVSSVTDNLFDLLGVQPMEGRLFRSGQNDADEQTRVVISAPLRRRLFGNRSLEGAALSMAGTTYEVIGVTPHGMDFPFRTDVWLLAPHSVEASGTGRGARFPVIRLRAGLDLETAMAQLAPAADRLRNRYGVGRQDFGFDLHSVRPDPMRFRRFHGALAGAAIAVLLIACGNLANLMLARGISRRRDVALQMAVGAGKGTIVRDVLLEVGLLGLAGGALGALVAVWGVNVLIAQLPPDLPLVGSLAPHLSWRVFAFALGATIVAMMLFGVLPAVMAANVDAAEPLKDSAGTTTGRTRRAYNPLVIAAVAGAIVLLMGAGLLFKAALRVGAYDFGYNPDGLLRVMLRLPPERYEQTDFNDTVEQALGRLQGNPAVADASWWGVRVAEDLVMTSDDVGRVMQLRTYFAVGPTFLRTLGITVRRGRDFAAGDRTGRGAVIVDETAAAKLWPGMDPIGRLIKLGGSDAPEQWVPVIGVARDVSMFFVSDPDLPPEPAVFHLPPQYDSRVVQFVVRSRDNDPRLAVVLGRQVRDVLPGVGVPIVRPWLRFFDDFVAARRFMATLFALFGTFALSLATIGLYGVLSYAVNRRMREFGVRIALGARRSDLIRLVLHEGTVMILAGTAIGALVAMWSAQLLSQWLYNVNPTDAVSLIGAELVLIAVSIAAAVVPGIRASRASPIDVLRAT